MFISSRTLEGWPSKCPMCGHVPRIESSVRTFDAPCPQCGHLLWFATSGDITSPLNASDLFAKTATVDFPDNLAIHEHVIRLIPESIARENAVLPLAETEEALIVAVTDSCNIETIEKLRFILNRQLHVIRVNEAWIGSQIVKHYGEDPPDAS